MDVEEKEGEGNGKGEEEEEEIEEGENSRTGGNKYCKGGGQINQQRANGGNNTITEKQEGAMA
jgi:hypothetical protein